MKYFLSLLFYSGARPIRLKSGAYEPTVPTNPFNKWRKIMTPKVGKVYTVQATDNTNRLAEEMQMNICDKRAVIISEWFGKVIARINIGRGLWTDSITLNVDDVK